MLKPKTFIPPEVLWLLVIVGILGAVSVMNYKSLPKHHQEVRQH